MTERHVVIVGGGVIGVSAAHYLRKLGWRVTIVEKGAIGQACSRGNCGFVSPSHVLPLAEPGVIRQAFQSLFNPDAPMRVKPRFDLQLFKWFWNFARRCNHRDLISGGHAIHPILKSARKLYQELVDDEGLHCEWQTRGLMFVYQDRDAFQAFAKTDKLLAEVFQEPAVKLEGEAARDLEPALKPGLAGGWFYEEDAHLRPDVLMASWKEMLGSRGVVFREQCEFRGFEQQNGSVTAVLTSQGAIPADAAVVATGALTPLIARHLGCSVPIQPGKGYSMTMARPTICPKIPMIFPQHRVAVTPMLTGYRLGSIMEFAGYDASINPRRLALLTKGAIPYLQEPTGEPVMEQWTGWRPMTWDSIPIIDRAPVANNAFIAAGHNMLGLSMAPATGLLVAELVSGQTPHLDPTPYRATRF